VKKTLRFLIDRLATPIGDMQVVADGEGNLRATFWTDHEEDLRRVLTRHYGGNDIELEAARNPHELTDALAGYFAGDLHGIDNLPVETAGTPFQRQVWRALREIPCGTTISYAQLAANRAALRSAGSWPGERVEPDWGSGTLPSRHRRERLPHRVWGRHREKALAARSRAAIALIRPGAAIRQM
jgi:O6-methylguanine-DNA--protein-cysteine methyltransferase